VQHANTTGDAAIDGELHADHCISGVPV
jgi:hypothetical protein